MAATSFIADEKNEQINTNGGTDMLRTSESEAFEENPDNLSVVSVIGSVKETEDDNGDVSSKNILRSALTCNQWPRC